MEGAVNNQWEINLGASGIIDVYFIFNGGYHNARIVDGVMSGYKKQELFHFQLDQFHHLRGTGRGILEKSKREN